MLVTVLVVEYFVLPQLAGARSAMDLLAAVSPGFLTLGLILELASLVSYSALTRSVLPHATRPRLWTVLRIDLSGLGVSHLLPGGGATASALRYRLFTVAGMAPADVLSATAIEGAGTAVVLALVFGAGLLLALPSASGNPYFLVAAVVAAVFLASGAGAVVLLTRRQRQTVGLVRAAAKRLPRGNPDTARRLSLNLFTSAPQAYAGDRG